MHFSSRIRWSFHIILILKRILSTKSYMASKLIYKIFVGTNGTKQVNKIRLSDCPSSVATDSISIVGSSLLLLRSLAAYFVDTEVV